MHAAAAFCDIEIGTTIFDKLGLDKTDSATSELITAAGLASESFVYTGKSCSVEKSFGDNTVDIFGAGELPLAAPGTL